MNSGPYTLVFDVLNSGTTTTTFLLTCSTTGGMSCVSVNPTSLTLAPDDDQLVDVTYSVGATSGNVTLTATGGGASDNGFFVVTAQSIQSPTVDVVTVNPGATVERDLCLTVAAGRKAAYECGDLRLVHPLPTTRTLSKARTPTLIYNSQHAHPYPLVAVNVGLPSGAATPDSAIVRLLDGSGVQKDRRKYTGSQWTAGRASRVAVRWDTLTVTTGVYSYTVEATFWFGATSRVTTAGGQLAVVNRKDSYFGSGWWLAGMEHLYYPTDTMKLWWVGGDGAVREYTRVTGTSIWRAPNVTRLDSLTRSGSPGAYTYYRYVPHGIKVQFDTYGRHVATINRLGYQTMFGYSAAPTDTLKTITLPPTGSGKVYTFAYSGNRLASVTAPSVVQGGQTVQRIVNITVSGGRVTLIRDPDNNNVGFGYVGGDTNRIVSRTDRRGKIVKYTYDSARRLIKDSLNLSTGSAIVSTFRSAETQGLTIAVDTAQVYTRLDGPRTDVGDTTNIWINRFGAPRRIRNALGNETTITRGDATWPALVTKVVAPNGQITAATYDGHGNPLTSTDSSTFLGGRYATTRNEWDPKWDFVTKIVPPENDSTVMSYDATTGNRLWQQDARGSTSRVTFRYYSTGSGSGLLEATQSPLGFKDSVVYDALGNLLATKSPRGYWTNHYPDGIGRDTLIRSPTDTTVTRFVRQHTTYNVMDRVLNSISAGDRAISGADSIVVASTFDPEGEPLSLGRTAAPDIAAIGTSTTQWRYDAAGRKVAEVSADGLVDSTAYDPAGNITAIVTRRGYTISMQYDTLNRLTRRIVPDVTKLDTTANSWHFPLYALPTFGDTATFTYDAMGNLLTAYNRDAQIKRTYNQNGTLQTDTLKIRTYAELSGGGNFTSHVYGLRHGYDLDGRRLYTKVPHQLGPHFAAAPTVIYDSISYSYATFGVLRTARDVLGNVFTYAYDLDGRPDTLGYPLGDYKHYTYDPDGNELTIHEDRTASGHQIQNNDIQAQYDVRGKIVQLIPNTSVAGWGWQPFQYNGLGPLYSNEQKSAVLNIITPRDNVDIYGVDALANVAIVTGSYNYSYHCSTATMSVTGESRHPRHYASGTGRLLSVSDSAAESYWSNDSSHCEGFFSGSSRSEAHQYDHAGNDYWSSVSGRDSTSGPSCNPGSFCPTNVTTGRTARYYDANSRLRAVDARSGATGSDATFYPSPPGFEEYRYDAMGRRVLRRARQLRATPANTLDQVQRFIWDGSQLIAEIQYPGSDAMSATQLERDTVTLTTESQYFGRVIYMAGEGMDRPVSIVRVGFGTVVGGQFRTWDPLDISPRWDAQGRVYDQAFYGSTSSCLTVGADTKCALPGWPARQAYGMSISYGTYAHVQYNGWWGSLAQDQMDATGHLYRRNRYYDQSTGRFTQEDPIGLAGGINLYGFADGDPVNFSDPFGLCPPHDGNTHDCPPNDKMGDAWRTLDKSKAGREVIDDYVKKGPTVDTDISTCQGSPDCSFREKNAVHVSGETPQEVALGLSHEIVHLLGHAKRFTEEFTDEEEPSAWDRELRVFDSFSPEDQAASGPTRYVLDFWRRDRQAAIRQFRCRDLHVDCE
jgi:RHS repeat-associated protein